MAGSHSSWRTGWRCAGGLCEGVPAAGPGQRQVHGCIGRTCARRADLRCHDMTAGAASLRILFSFCLFPSRCFNFQTSNTKPDKELGCVVLEPSLKEQKKRSFQFAIAMSASLAIVSPRPPPPHLACLSPRTRRPPSTHPPHHKHSRRDVVITYIAPIDPIAALQSSAPPA